MTKFNKDILFLAINNMSISIMHTWPMMVTYQASYMHFKNPSSTFTEVFFCTLFFGLGRVLFGFVTQQYFYYLGYYGSFIGSAIILTVRTYLQIHATSLIGLYSSYLLLGVNQYLITNLDNLIISTKLNGQISLVKYLTLFRMSCALIWANVLKYIMNPKNLPFEIIAKNGDHFYGDEVSERFPIFLEIYWLFSIFFVLIPIFTIDAPKEMRGGLFSKDVSFEEFEESLNNSQQKLVKSFIEEQEQSIRKLSMDKPQHKIEEMLPKNKSDFYEQDQIEFFSQKMPFIVFLITIQFFLQMAICLYNINIYKYVSLLIGFRDADVTLQYTISCFTNFSGSFIISYIWDTKGEKFTMGFIVTLNLLLMCYVSFTQFYPTLYIYCLLVLRSVVQMNETSQNFFSFGLFNEQGIKYQKYLQIGIFCGQIGNLMIYQFFFDENNVYRGFNITTVLAFISFFLFLKNLNRFKKDVSQFFEMKNQLIQDN